MRRHAITRYSSDVIGIATYDQGVLTDADATPTLGIIKVSDNGIVVAPGTLATHDGLGLYSYTLSSANTSFLDDYVVTWNYTMSATARTFVTGFYVVEQQPYWDLFTQEQRVHVDSIYSRFSDGFDSRLGGPYLWELPQAAWGFETVARIMATETMNYINYTFPPALNPPFVYGGTTGNQLGTSGLVEEVASYFVMRHLARSYLEQPDPVNVNTAYEDRRNYYDKWTAEADREKEVIDGMLKIFKRAYQFGLYSRALLIAGGMFPISFLNPARPRWPYVIARF